MVKYKVIEDQILGQAQNLEVAERWAKQRRE